MFFFVLSIYFVPAQLYKVYVQLDSMPAPHIGCVWFAGLFLAWLALTCPQQATPWLFGMSKLG
jgi:hypothetical protein